MKRFIVSLTILLTLHISSGFAADGGELLWWMISDLEAAKAEDEAGNVYSAADLGVTDARVKYVDTDGSTTYLTLLGLRDDGVKVYDGAAGVLLPAEYYADVSGLSGGAGVFAIELGNWADGAWTKTTMESESLSYSQLVGLKHISSWNESINGIYGRAWTPTHYLLVPEPCTGALLVFVGVMALLRRPKPGDRS